MSSDMRPPDEMPPRGYPGHPRDTHPQDLDADQPEPALDPDDGPDSGLWQPAWERTSVLPPSYLPPPNVKLPAERGPRSRRRALITIASVLLALIVATVGLLNVLRPSKAPPANKTVSCASGTPCEVADQFLAAYSGGDYEAMYKLTSAASQTRFSDKAILQGNYKDAQDYIVNRTAGLLNAAHIYSMAVTPGKVTQTSDTKAAIAARVDMTSSWLGAFSENITVPLVKEQGVWRVNWSPGLVFPQIDDSADPHYTRRVRLHGVTAARGTIYDRDGHVLAEDETVYQIGVDPTQLKNESTVLKVLSASLGVSASQIQSKYQGASGFVAVRTVPPQDYQKIQSAINSVVPDGVQVQPVSGRVYPYGADLEPVTGLVQPVAQKDLDNDPTGYYDNSGQAQLPPQFIGRYGVEAWGEKYLRPTKGGQLVIVPVNGDGSDGQPVYTIAQRSAVPGDDVHTTISLKDQLATMAALRTENGHSSGVLALAPTTGEVLVMASNPSCDPNDFSLVFQPNIDACVNNPADPLLNYAVQGAVPTGSVFKVVTLAAALENGIPASQVFTCKGSYQVPGTSIVIHEPEAGGHGNLTAPGALPPSCDVIYAQVAVLLNSKDPNILPNMAKSLGFGASTGIVGVPDGVEAAGIVPDPQYVQQVKNGQWTDVDAANLGIGQGDFEATPAQVAMLAAGIGNNGKRMQPRLVSSVTASGASAPVVSFPATQLTPDPISANNLATIQGAMLGAVNDPSGTSYGTFKGFKILVAGKTGTAESGQAQPHAWFASYAPASPLSGPPVTPQIAMGISVHYAGFGAEDAAPISRKLLEAYFGV